MNSRMCAGETKEEMQRRKVGLGLFLAFFGWFCKQYPLESSELNREFCGHSFHEEITIMLHRRATAYP